MLFLVFTIWYILCVWVFDNSYVHQKQALSVHEIYVEQKAAEDVWHAFEPGTSLIKPKPRQNIISFLLKLS